MTLRETSSAPLGSGTCVSSCRTRYSTNWATTLISAPAHSTVHIHLHTILLVLNQLSYNPHLCPCPQYSAYTSAHNSVGTQPTELQPSSLPLPTVQCIYICTQFCWYSTNWATTLTSAPAHSTVHIHLHTILLVLNQLSYNPHLCPCPQYSACTSAHNSVEHKYSPVICVIQKSRKQTKTKTENFQSCKRW